MVSVNNPGSTQVTGARCSTLRQSMAKLLIVLVAIVFISCCTGESGNGGSNAGASTDSVPVTAAQLNLTLEATKIFRFTWTDVVDATYYRVLENLDGQSGFTQISGDIQTGVGNYVLNLNLPLYDRFNASYLLQSCNARGCVNDNILYITGSMSGAIGYIKPSVVSPRSNFGFDIEFNSDGNLMAVSALDEGDAGAVYLFTKINNVWTERAIIKANNAEAFDDFGWAIAISGDANTLVVGAPGESSNSQSSPNDNSLVRAGAVYVFERSPVSGTWLQTAYLKANYVNEWAWFGISVSLSEDGSTLAVGAYGENSSSQGIGSTPIPTNVFDSYGAVYVFSKVNGTWNTSPIYIKPIDSQLDAHFGESVSLSGNGSTLIVGAPRMDDGIPDSGAVYYFTKDNAGLWSQIGKIKPKALSYNGNTFVDVVNEDEWYGSSVEITQDASTLAVFALQNSIPVVGMNVYVPNGADTSNPAYVPLSETVLSHFSSAVYVFKLNQGEWEQQAFIKPNILRRNSALGNALAFSADGETLIIGNTWEQSISTGVNQNEDNSATRNGAVFIYSRIDSTSWAQSGYLKSPLFKDGQDFGWSAAIDAFGTTVAVGAVSEKGANPGINPEYVVDSNNVGAGAVYIY